MVGALAVLLASDDPGWLIFVEQAVTMTGHVVVGTCPDVISLVAQSCLDVADVVIVDSAALSLERGTVVRVRRLGLAVVEVGGEPSTHRAAPFFEAVENALAWATTQRGRCGVVCRSHSVIAVFGCKGAPGATTLAIDLVEKISRTTSVALVDLDVRGGDIGTRLRMPEHPNVVSAAQAIGQDAPWLFTGSRGRASVITAPSRPGWDSDVVPSDIGALLDDIGLCVVDAGVASLPSDLMQHVVARAAHVVLVGGTTPTHRVHLQHAQATLKQLGVSVHLVTENHRKFASRLAFACAQTPNSSVRPVEV